MRLGRRICGAPVHFRPTRILAGMVWSNLRPMVRPAAAYRRAPAGTPGQVTYVGHATCLIELPGLTVVTDPVWSTRVLLPRRLVAPGVPLEGLPPVDVVLISHAHMDHCDRPSLARLARRFPGATLVTPSGFGDLVRGLGFARHVELSLWEGLALPRAGAGRRPGDGSGEGRGPAAGQAPAARITLVPARHWGRRSGFDRGVRGFGGFVVEAGGRAVYFAGDTGYFDGFVEIGHRFPALDVALLPIGAYSPSSFRLVHCDPEDALRAFLDLGAARLVPIHWGTFVLSYEPIGEPMARLEAMVAGGPLDARVARLAHGETLVLDPVAGGAGRPPAGAAAGGAPAPEGAPERRARPRM